MSKLMLGVVPLWLFSVVGCGAGNSSAPAANGAAQNSVENTADPAKEKAPEKPVVVDEKAVKEHEAVVRNLIAAQDALADLGEKITDPQGAKKHFAAVRDAMIQFRKAQEARKNHIKQFPGGQVPPEANANRNVDGLIKELLASQGRLGQLKQRLKEEPEIEIVLSRLFSAKADDAILAEQPTSNEGGKPSAESKSPDAPAESKPANEPGDQRPRKQPNPPPLPEDAAS